MKLFLLLISSLFLIAVSAQDEIDCKAIYEQLYQTVPPEFAKCAPEPIAAGQCEGEVLGQEKTATNLLILLDASGSMAAQVGNEVKMDTAKSAVVDFMNSLDPSIQTGLIVFGHKGSNQEQGKAESCEGVELIYPLAKIDNISLTAAINSFKPTGYTPIASALELAQNTLENSASESSKNWIYLISDGEETCGGEPVKIAEQIAAQGTETIINVVGFDVAQAGQLKAVATAGKGEYFSANNREELKAFFDQRKEKLQALVSERNCLREQKATAWFHNHSERYKFYICMRKERNKTWRGIRKARFQFLKNKDPRKVCNPQIDNWNDAWLDGINRWTDTEMERLAADRDTGAAELQQMIDELELERQRILDSEP